MICRLLVIVSYFLKKLAGSLQCSIIPILICIESILDKGQDISYSAHITFPKSQTDRKQGRPIRRDTVPLLPRPGPLFMLTLMYAERNL